MPFRKPGHLPTLRTECPADERRRFEDKYYAVQGLCGIGRSPPVSLRRGRHAAADDPDARVSLVVVSVNRTVVRAAHIPLEASRGIDKLLTLCHECGDGAATAAGGAGVPHTARLICRTTLTGRIVGAGAGTGDDGANILPWFGVRIAFALAEPPGGDRLVRVADLFPAIAAAAALVQDCETSGNRLRGVFMPDRREVPARARFGFVWSAWVHLDDHTPPVAPPPITGGGFTFPASAKRPRPSLDVDSTDGGPTSSEGDHHVDTDSDSDAS